MRWQDGGRRGSRRFASEAEAIAFAETVVVRSPGRPASIGSIARPNRGPRSPRASRRTVRLPATASTPTNESGHALALRVPTVRRQGVLATRLHEPLRCRHGAPTPRGVDRSRRGQGGARNVRHYWAQLLEARRPYLTAGSFANFEAHGRKRLLPTFASVPLARVDEDLAVAVVVLGRDALIGFATSPASVRRLVAGPNAALCEGMVRSAQYPRISAKL